jgi:hypothetical protein
VSVWQLVVQHAVAAIVGLVAGVRLGVFLEQRRRPRSYRLIIAKESDRDLR